MMKKIQKCVPGIPGMLPRRFVTEISRQFKQYDDTSLQNVESTNNLFSAVKYYKVTVLTMNEYQPEFDDRSTSDYRYLEYQAREGVSFLFDPELLVELLSDSFTEMC